MLLLVSPTPGTEPDKSTKCQFLTSILGPLSLVPGCSHYLLILIDFTGRVLYFTSEAKQAKVASAFSSHARTPPLRHTKRKLTGFLPSCCVFFLTIKGFIRSSVLRRSRTTAQQAPRQVSVLGCARFL